MTNMAVCTPDSSGAQCKTCGLSLFLNGKPILRDCGGEEARKQKEELEGGVESAAEQGTQKLGVTLNDARHYAVALARWTKAGFPTREQSEVERIETEICKPCDQYVDGRCRKCGCRVNQGMALVNKIKMATESCPAGKW